MVKFVDMSVEYVDHMGSDLSVVNAARVSFHKQSTALSEKDEKLIAFLAKRIHFTPFGHAALSLRIKAPIFVARQLGKHQVGLVWNEVSRRYVDEEPEFYRPEFWRARADNVKQGSREDAISLDGVVQELYEIQVEQAFSNYHACLNYYGVCPEQARMMLPQSMMTEWIWTGSLAAWGRVLKLRLDPHTQKETRDIAALILPIVEQHFPISTKALLA